MDLMILIKNIRDITGNRNAERVINCDYRYSLAYTAQN